MSIVTYSLKKDGNKKVSENFSVKEFRCKDGSDKILISTDTVKILQSVHDYFGQTVKINSAYRTPAYNKKVGGASASQHVKGTACDIAVSNVPPKAVAAYIEAHFNNYGGIGLYSTFVHVDTRGYKVRWKNSGSNTVLSFKLGNIYEQYKAKKGVEETMTEQQLKEYVDSRINEVLKGTDTKVSSWAEAELEEAKKMGITDGSRPQGYVTREQCAVMALRACKTK